MATVSTLYLISWYLGPKKVVHVRHIFVWPKYWAGLIYQVVLIAEVYCKVVFTGNKMIVLLYSWWFLNQTLDGPNFWWCFYSFLSGSKTFALIDYVFHTSALSRLIIAF